MIPGPEPAGVPQVCLSPDAVLQPQRQSVQPYAPSRARIAFDCDKDLPGKLERAREVLRHKFPAGKYEDIFNEALEALLDRKDPENRLRNKKARKSAAGGQVHTRRIPQRVKDEGNCLASSSVGGWRVSAGGRFLG